MLPTFPADPELERLLELRDKDPERFDELADLSNLVALKSYEPRRAAAIAAGAAMPAGGDES